MGKIIGFSLSIFVLQLSVLATSASAETLQGTWKLVAAEDLRDDGAVARHPWGVKTCWRYLPISPTQDFAPLMKRLKLERP